MTDPIRSYLAECFWPGVTQAQVQKVDGNAARSADASADGEQDVRYLGSVLLAEDEVVLCFFQAHSAEAVEAVATDARIPYARIVESTWTPTQPQGDPRADEPLL